jgi:predicted nucleic acid-binding protein
MTIEVVISPVVVALGAGVIVSGDDHLKRIKKYAGIAIVSPREFVEEYKIV